MSSPGFSKFRELIDQWDKWLEQADIATHVKALVDSEPFTFFFKKGGEFYATGEEGRITFATMKDDKDEEMPEGWKDEATFMAQNLSRIVKGDPAPGIFSIKDLGQIKPVDKEIVCKGLTQQAHTHGVKLNVGKPSHFIVPVSDDME